MRRTAFTLVEILVVVAILAILAAVLFPVFGRARENARRSSCLSNMRQIGLGIAQYTQDFDERLPFSTGTTPDPLSGRWPNKIASYVKNTQVFVCPSYTEHRLPANFLAFTAGGWNGSSSTYGINENLSEYRNPGPLSPGDSVSRHLGELKSPSETALIAEVAELSANGNALLGSPDNLDPTSWENHINKTAWNKGNSDWQWVPPGQFGGSGVTSYLSPGPSNVNMRRPLARHFDGLNVVYCDGHAKWVPITQFLGPMPGGWPYGHPNNSWDNL